MASGFWTGMERATGNLAQTGMGILNYQANERQRDTANAMLERRVNLAEEQGAREQRAFEITQRKIDEQNAKDLSWIPASSVVTKWKEHPEWTKSNLTALDSMTEKGYEGYGYREVGGELFIQSKGLKYLGNITNTNTEFKKTSTDALLTDLTSKNVTLEQQIADAQMKGDKKTLETLLPQRKILQEQMANTMTVLDKVKAEFDKEGSGENTADIKNYKYAKAQGYTGTFEEYTKKKGDGGYTRSEIETRKKHLLDTYKTPTDKMGRIKTLTSSGRLSRISGWLSARNTEENVGALSQSELDIIEQGIMTDLGVDLQMQDTIRLARESGATNAEINELVRASIGK
jgi:hypothetical protein